MQRFLSVEYGDRCFDSGWEYTGLKHLSQIQVFRSIKKSRRRDASNKMESKLVLNQIQGWESREMCYRELCVPVLASINPCL